MTAKAALDAIAQNPAEMLSLADNKAATKKRQEYFRRLPKEKQMELVTRVLQPFIATSQDSAIAHPVLITPPDDIRVPEYYMRLLNSYVRGSVEANNWPRDAKSGFKNEDTVPAWCSSVMSAAVVLKDGRNAEAIQFLRHFIRQAPIQLSRQDPLLFSFVYTSVLFFARDHLHIAQWLLQNIYHVSETLPWAGSSHPLRLLIQVIFRLGPKEMIAHARPIILAYISVIHDTLGTAYPIVQDMMSDTIWRLLRYELMSADEVVNLGRRMVLAAELQGQDRCKDHLNLKMHLASAYLKTRNYREARLLTEEIMGTQYEDFHNERMMPSLHMTISRIDEAEGRLDKAMESACKAVIVSRKIFGDWSDWALNSLNFYSQVLKKANETKLLEGVLLDLDYVVKKLEGQTISN